MSDFAFVPKLIRWFMHVALILPNNSSVNRSVRDLLTEIVRILPTVGITLGKQKREKKKAYNNACSQTTEWTRRARARTLGRDAFLKTESIKIYLPISSRGDDKIHDGICRYNSRGKITRYKFKFIFNGLRWNDFRGTYFNGNKHFITVIIYLSPRADGVPSFSPRFFLMCIGLSYRIPDLRTPLCLYTYETESYRKTIRGGRRGPEYYGIKRGGKPLPSILLLKMFEDKKKLARFNVTSKYSLFNLANLPWNEAPPTVCPPLSIYFIEISGPREMTYLTGPSMADLATNGGRGGGKGGYQFVVGGTVNRTVFGDSSIVLRRFAWFWATL